MMKLILFIILTILTPVRWSGEAVGDSMRLTAEVDSGWHMTLISIGDSIIGEDYEGTFTMTVAANDVQPIRYTACDDQQCLAPEIYDFATEVPPDLIGTSLELHRNFIGTSTGSQADDVGVLQAPAQSLWLLFLLGLLGGLLAIFTPCVWPIIPMTVSFFLKKGGGLRDAVWYGVSIVIIYVGLGLLITLLFGASALNALATNAIVNLFFFALLVVFALSFFGLFEITLPDSWATRIDGKARATSGLLSIWLMAFTLVVVSFSCTGPIIGTLLVEAAGRNVLAPAIGMLGFAIALALPFALFAMFPQWMQRLPKSGEWMQDLKVTLAFVELALSLKFFSVADMAYGWGLLPRWLFIAIWIACFAGLGIYWIIRLVRQLKAHATWLTALCSALIAAASLLFAAYLIPGLWGAPVKAIAAFAPPETITDREVFYDYEEGLQYARQTGKPIIVDFTGYGCVNCRKMEKYVLADERVQERLKDYVYIMLYVDSRRDDNGNGIEDGVEFSRLQQEQFHSNAQPYFVRLDPSGMMVGEPCAFTVEPEIFINWMK